MIYLICEICGERETITNETEFVHCHTCRAPRYAKNEEGKDVVVFTNIQVKDKW